MSPPAEVILHALLRLEKTGRQEMRGAPVGSTSRPFDLFVPEWLEARAHRDGTTCQEIADNIFIPAVKVTVVK